jgi:hypothetical protein
MRLQTVRIAALLLALVVTGCGDNLAPPSPDGRGCVACNHPDPIVTCQAGYHLVDNHCEPDPDYGSPDAGVDGAP